MKMGLPGAHDSRCADGSLVNLGGTRVGNPTRLLCHVVANLLLQSGFNLVVFLHQNLVSEEVIVVGLSLKTN